MLFSIAVKYYTKQYYTIPAINLVSLLMLIGIDAFIPPIVSFVLFIIVTLITQKKDLGYNQFGVVD